MENDTDDVDHNSDSYNDTCSISYQQGCWRNSEMEWNSWGSFYDDTSITIESEELSEASEDNSKSVKGAIADKEAEEVSITKVSDEFRCEICDFTTNRRKGLHIHISKKHAKIEQLDGNTILCLESESDDDNNNPDGLDGDLIGQKLEEQRFLSERTSSRPWSIFTSNSWRCDAT